jgi:hypothetical protein
MKKFVFAVLALFGLAVAAESQAADVKVQIGGGRNAVVRGGHHVAVVRGGHNVAVVRGGSSAVTCGWSAVAWATGSCWSRIVRR